MESIEQLICTMMGEQWLQEKDINIIEGLISLWRYARESYDNINGFKKRKKQWIPNGKKIKTLLGEKNVGLEDLAAHLNMTVGNTDMLLYGIKPVSVDTAVRIAIFLNCQIEDIVRYTGEDSSSAEK